MSDATKYPNAVYLTVADPRRSIRFYSKLGFSVDKCWPDARKPLHASLVLDRQTVMVGTSLSEKQAKEVGVSKNELRRVRKDHKAFKKHRHGVGVHVYLLVADVDAHHRDAVRRKVEVVRPLTTHFYGMRDYVAADPDGYQLVFYTQAEVTDEIAPAPRKKRRKAETPVASEVLVAEPELVPQ